MLDTVDEAIQLVNSGKYGNMACVFTSSGAAARKFRYEAQAGNIGINIGVAAPDGFLPLQRLEGELLWHAARAGKTRGRVLHPDQGGRRALAERMVATVLGTGRTGRSNAKGLCQFFSQSGKPGIATPRGLCPAAFNNETRGG